MKYRANHNKNVSNILRCHPQYYSGSNTAVARIERNSPPQHIYLNYPGVSELFIKQKTLGWSFLMLNFLTHDWAKSQNKHFLLLKSRKTNITWVSMPIRKILEQKHNLWISINLVVNPFDTKNLDIDKKCADVEITISSQL